MAAGITFSAAQGQATAATWASVRPNSKPAVNAANLERVVVIASQKTIRLQTTCKASDVRWKANGDGPATSWMSQNASAQPPVGPRAIAVVGEQQEIKKPAPAEVAVVLEDCKVVGAKAAIEQRPIADDARDDQRHDGKSTHARRRAVAT